LSRTARLLPGNGGGRRLRHPGRRGRLESGPRWTANQHEIRTIQRHEIPKRASATLDLTRNFLFMRQILVPRAGLEPACACARRINNPHRRSRPIRQDWPPSSRDPAAGAPALPDRVGLSRLRLGTLAGHLEVSSGRQTAAFFGSLRRMIIRSSHQNRANQGLVSTFSTRLTSIATDTARSFTWVQPKSGASKLWADY
jgi:hypothetical protein